MPSIDSQKNNTFDGRGAQESNNDADTQKRESIIHMIHNYQSKRENVNSGLESLYEEANGPAVQTLNLWTEPSQNGYRQYNS